MKHPVIDPALGLDLTPKRTLTRATAKVSVIIPAHNEEATIDEVVTEALRSLKVLDVPGDVTVSASACTDQTAELAERAGARVVTAPIGKGAAVAAGLAATDGDVVCLIDGDLQYFGEPPLAALLVDPILHGVSDACVSDLYWRPLYPQMWLHGFFAPIAGFLFPELLPKTGSTPWSGQRAALRHLWPESLPEDFTVDLALLLHWNTHAKLLRPVLADDWVNPQRPKPDLMYRELQVLIQEALRQERISPDLVDPLLTWYGHAHTLMASYRHDDHDPQQFERQILLESLHALHIAVLQ